MKNLNRLVTNKEIETVIKIFPQNKNLGPDGFSGKFSKPSKQTNSSPSHTFPKNREGMLPNTF